MHSFASARYLTLHRGLWTHWPSSQHRVARSGAEAGHHDGGGGGVGIALPLGPRVTCVTSLIIISATWYAMSSFTLSSSRPINRLIFWSPEEGCRWYGWASISASNRPSSLTNPQLNLLQECVMSYSVYFPYLLILFLYFNFFSYPPTYLLTSTFFPGFLIQISYLPSSLYLFSLFFPAYLASFLLIQ